MRNVPIADWRLRIVERTDCGLMNADCGIKNEMKKQAEELKSEISIPKSEMEERWIQMS